VDAAVGALHVFEAIAGTVVVQAVVGEDVVFLVRLHFGAAVDANVGRRGRWRLIHLFLM